MASAPPPPAAGKYFLDRGRQIGGGVMRKGKIRLKREWRQRKPLPLYPIFPPSHIGQPNTILLYSAPIQTKAQSQEPPLLLATAFQGKESNTPFHCGAPPAGSGFSSHHFGPAGALAATRVRAGLSVAVCTPFLLTLATPAAIR